MAAIHEQQARTMLEAALVIAQVINGRSIAVPTQRDDVLKHATAMADKILEQWHRDGVQF